MQIQHWNTLNKQKGVHFKPHTDVITPDYEWMYTFDHQKQISQIGIIGWPERKHCMIQRAVLEKKAFEIVCNKHEVTLYTATTHPQGVITGRTAGMEETLKLIAFLGGYDTTYLYRASQFKEGTPSDILVFDRSPPSEEHYQCGSTVPINFVERRRIPGKLARAYRWVTRA